MNRDISSGSIFTDNHFTDARTSISSDNTDPIVNSLNKQITSASITEEGSIIHSPDKSTKPVEEQVQDGDSDDEFGEFGGFEGPNPSSLVNISTL